MKKIILTLIFISTLIIAEETPILKATPIETSNEFILAQAQYKLGDYTSSYQQFKKLFLKHTDNEEINYYLAMSAVHLKLYDEATAAFERVLIVNPEYHRARLEYARVQFLLGFKEEAKKEFLKVAQYPIPENVRKNIEMYLKKIDGSSNESTFIALSFGFMYDDNVNSGIEFDSYNLPGFFNVEVNGEKPESSTSYLTSFQINHINSLAKDSPFIIKHTGTMFYKNQTKQDKYNFSYYAYTPTIYYNDVVNSSEYSLNFGIEKIYPGDRVDFTTYSLTPQYKVLINKNSVFSAFAGFKEFHYNEIADENKDYTKTHIGSSIKYKDFEYNIEFDEDDRKRGTRTDINKKSVAHTFMYQYNIQSSLFLNLKYEHKKIEYENTDVFFSSKRKDNINQYNVGLTKVINKKDFLSLTYTKTNNNTNQAAYEYNKDTINMNYTWRFKL